MHELIMLGAYAVLALVGLLAALFALWLALSLAYGAATLFFQSLIALADAIAWLLMLPGRIIKYVTRRITQ